MNCGLDHVALGVKDFDIQLQFLTETMGLKLKRLGTRHSTGSRIAFLADHESDFKIELVEVSDEETGVLHLAFRVDDVYTEYQNSITNGLTSIREPHELSSAKAKTALLQFGSGMKIQIIEYASDSPDI